MAHSTAIYERNGLVATVTYLGSRAWKLVASAAEVQLDNSSISRAICEALHIGSPPERQTRIAIRAEHIRNGVVANNTYPPDAWWYDVDPGAAGTELDLHAAVWNTLSSLRLRPPVAAPRSPFADPRFAAAALAEVNDQMAWATELALAAEAWLGTDSSQDEVRELMFALRASGHPLCSFDESDEHLQWSTSGAEGAQPRLDIEVRILAYEPPQVVVSVDSVRSPDRSR